MKKVSYDDIRYIGKYKRNSFFERYFCNWYISMSNRNEGWIKCRIKLWFYMLTFIPICLINFIGCLWDGGIKNFGIESRTIHHYNTTGLVNDGDETQFGRLKIIYNTKGN